MRQIGTIPAESDAQMFRAWLKTRGIDAMVEADGDAWAVWTYDEDQVTSAHSEFATFLNDPGADQYHQAQREAREIEEAEAVRVRRIRSNRVDVRQQWQRPQLTSCRVTMILIIISVGVLVAATDWNGLQARGLFMETCGRAFDDDADFAWLPITRIFQNQYRPLADVLREGQIWRPITPIFIHLNPLHILFNMIWLRDLGCGIEYRRGSPLFLLIILVIAALSNIAQYAMRGPYFGGMSGVVYGLLGFAWTRGRFAPHEGLIVNPSVMMWMMIWYFLCLSGGMGHVANWCHTVGLVSGGALALIRLPGRRTP